MESEYGYPEHDRWGTAAAIVPNLRINIPNANNLGKISLITHPEYDYWFEDWSKWRSIMEGGDNFNEKYIEKFSERESATNFRKRKKITPTAAFAKGAIVEIKNSIFQRTSDINRSGGSNTYLQACDGKLGGIDLKDGSMNWFLAHYIIPELLSMKKVGVFVDSPNFGLTKADKGDKHPYFYHYKAEDIRSWKYQNNQLVSLLLRDYIFDEDPETGLPTSEVIHFRLLKLTDKGVEVTIYDEMDKVIQETVTLNIPKIPFVTFCISDSLLKDIANHQLALANLESSDLSYIMNANFPLYTEQVNDIDYRNVRAAQQQSQQVIQQIQAGTSVDPDPQCIIPNEPRKSIAVGSSQGREYGKGLERPAFIHPSSEPLKASMEKQEQIKKDIRALVHLALANLQPRSASEESKKMDDRGLDAGLSYVGLEIEHGDRELCDIWHLYENVKDRTTIIYPKRWSLKTEDDIQKEVKSLEEFRDSIPSATFQKEISKQIVKVSVGNKIKDTTLETILKEIDQADAITADADEVREDHRAGLVSDKTASKLRGYPESEIVQARKDRAERAALVVQAQSKVSGGEDLSGRGVPELETDPNKSVEEKIDKPTRGPAQ